MPFRVRGTFSYHPMILVTTSLKVGSMLSVVGKYLYPLITRPTQECDEGKIWYRDGDFRVGYVVEQGRVQKSLVALHSFHITYKLS